MADKTGIRWAGSTLNPCYGCSPVSPACDHCYAARMAGRLGKLTEGTHKDGQWTGKINLHPERMLQALRWSKPRRIFVGSMTDIFHPAIPDSFLDEIFGVMLACEYLDNQKRHQFILLTKRPERMRAYLSQEPPTSMIRRWATANDGVIHLDNPDILFSEAVGGYCSGEWDEYGRLAGESKDWGFPNGQFPLPNTILMATIEDQPRADERMPILAELTGMGWHTGVSVEPMLGPVDLTHWLEGWMCRKCGVARLPMGEHGYCDCPLPDDPDEAQGDHRPGMIDWVICGGESGPDARPMHPDWARSLRDQCAAAGVPFFYKQTGEWAPARAAGIYPGVPRADYTDGTCLLRVGKHAAGRLLDGVEHNEFPEARS